MKNKNKPEAGGMIYKNHLVMVGLMNIPSRPGVGGQLFSAVAEAGIHVELIVNVSDWEQRDHIVLCVDREQLEPVVDMMQQIQKEVGGESLIQNPDVALVSIFSTDMEDSHSVAGHMFKALGDRDINIHGISTSVSTITCLIGAGDLEAAVAALREAFTLF